MSPHDQDPGGQRPIGVRHGVPTLPECVCRRAACGGVADLDMTLDCPFHGRSPALYWHQADDCPATRPGRTTPAGNRTEEGTP